MEEFTVFPPDFRVVEAGLVTGSNVSVFSIPGLVDIESHHRRKRRLLLPDAATEYRSGCSCSSGGRAAWQLLS